MAPRAFTSEQVAAAWRRMEAGEPPATAARNVGMTRIALDGYRRRMKLDWPTPSIEALRSFDRGQMPDEMREYLVALDDWLTHPTDEGVQQRWRTAAKALLGNMAERYDFKELPIVPPRAIAD